MKPILLATAGLVAIITSAQAAPLYYGERVWSTAATTYTSGNTTLSGTSEIVAFEPASASNGNTARLYIAAGAFIDVLDANTGARIASLRLPENSGGVNSVAVNDGKLAVSIDGPTAGSNGTVAIYDTSTIPTSGSNGLTTIAPQRTFTVGAVPDMVTFTPDGNTVLVANEGEYVSASNNPDGSISVIDVSSSSPADWSETKATFDSFDSADLRASGVRVFGDPANPNDTPSASAELEPEYISVSKDGKTAYVTLQEANAVAVVDISNPDNPSVTSIESLGYKDYSQPRNALDPSDRDGPNNTNVKGNLQTVNNVEGMYQPDAINTFELNGKQYSVIANEGDARVGEETRIGGNSSASRLNVTRDVGITADENGDPVSSSTRYSYGGRSFSILDDQGNLIWDSGSTIERILKDNYPDLIADNRDDDKGPEPEVVEIVQVDGRTLLYVGLERTTKGTILVFDLTGFDESSTYEPTYLGAIIDPNFTRVEGLDTVTMNGNIYLAASFEGDDSFATRGTSLYLIHAPEPASLALLGAGLAGLAVARRKRKG